MIDPRLHFESVRARIAHPLGGDVGAGGLLYNPMTARPNGTTPSFFARSGSSRRSISQWDRCFGKREMKHPPILLGGASGFVTNRTSPS
jgi:hypothetical protein